MRTARVVACLFAMASFAGAWVVAQQAHPVKNITVYGQLTRVMAIGAETTGWSLELKHEIMLEGKKMRSVEISGPSEQFEKLKDQRVKVRGILTHHTGVERPDHLVLEVSSIRGVQ